MMKKIVYLATSISLILSVIVTPVVVSALASNGYAHVVANEAIKATESIANDESNTATSNKNTSIPKDDAEGRAARLEREKKELKEALTTASKNRIAERCMAAQDKVKTKTTGNEAAATARTNAYENIVVKLQKLITSAQAKNVDTAELQAEIVTLQVKISAFSTANTIYHQALMDLGALDCKTDPVAFKAALEAARTYQKDVLSSAKDIRTYLTTVVKTTLQTLKNQLQAAE